MQILEAVRQRTSVRSYDEQPVEPDRLEHLLALAKAIEPLTDAPPRVALVSGADQTQHIISHVIGSYGLVLTPPHLLVGVLPRESDVARIDLGYVLEQVVLEATRFGLGTCWITGTYDAQSAGDAVGLSPGEVAAAVIALGTPSQRSWGRVHTRTIRRLAGGHKRKPLTEIVFAEQWGEPWSPEGADPAPVFLLEHARLAPSAANRQPWRFIVQANSIALALTRPHPIDAGIVMAHVTLAAAALGHGGQWHVRWGEDELAQTCGLPQDAVPVATFEGALA
ncbi:MAG: nitroreductase family protein [Anaerolineae bacterium]|nr:nitroreductase family protein [Anaerolineae bacterium]